MIRQFLSWLDHRIDIEADCRSIIKAFLTVAGAIAMVVVFMMAVAGR